MKMATIMHRLEACGTLRVDEPMSRHTTFGIGGCADLYLKVATTASLLGAVSVARQSRLPLFILGSGSNVLVGDRGIRGLVIENDVKEVKVIDAPNTSGEGSVCLRVDSGMSFAGLARRLCRQGLTGLEWAVGIPGTLGGAVVYNAGAYGGCLADVLIAIDVVDRDGQQQRLPAEVLRLEYRSSAFTRGLVRDRVILAVDLALREGESKSVMRQMAELDSKRKAAQPPGRNAGSIFKNPTERPAWWYIDQVGLRGARAGDAEISHKHANFFMNRGQARAAEVKALMDEAERRVRERFGVELHNEVELVGEGFDAPGIQIVPGQTFLEVQRSDS